MTEWIKRLQGYVKIRVWGFAPQRFINLCSNKGVLLWNIEKQDDIYTMCVSLKAFYQLRPIARKTKVRVVISERCGLPFLVPGMLRRKAFFAGFFLTAAFWILSSFFVWDIQVFGNLQVTEDLFFKFLEQEGVHTGMWKSNLDIGELEKQIRRNFPQVTWTSGRLDGVRLLIELKENDMPIPEETAADPKTGRDLVSQYDGVITEMIVRSGVPKVTTGSEVAKGDILVEGRIPIYAEDGTVREYRPVVSDADIRMEHTGTFEVYLPADYIQKSIQGEKNVLFSSFRRQRVEPEGKIRVFAIRQHPRHLSGKSTGIPAYSLYTWQNHLSGVSKTEYSYTAQEAKAVLQKKILDFLESLDEKGVQIISKDVKIETKCAGWTAHGELILRETAGVLTDSVPDVVEDLRTEDTDGNEE